MTVKASNKRLLVVVFASAFYVFFKVINLILPNAERHKKEVMLKPFSSEERGFIHKHLWRGNKIKIYM